MGLRPVSRYEVRASAYLGSSTASTGPPGTTTLARRPAFGPQNAERPLAAAMGHYYILSPVAGRGSWPQKTHRGKKDIRKTPTHARGERYILFWQPGDLGTHFRDRLHRLVQSHRITVKCYRWQPTTTHTVSSSSKRRERHLIKTNERLGCYRAPSRSFHASND